MAFDYQQVRLCNCAQCGIQLLGQQQTQEITPKQRKLLPPQVAGRKNGRPGCAFCLANPLIPEFTDNLSVGAHAEAQRRKDSAAVSPWAGIALGTSELPRSASGRPSDFHSDQAGPTPARGTVAVR